MPSCSKSLMLKTPVALELVLLCLNSFGGDDERPSMAESTLVSGDVVSADMIGMMLWLLECSGTTSKAFSSY